MSIGLVFWIIMLLWALFSSAWYWGAAGFERWGMWGNALLLFVLFFLLGWKVFGAPIHG